MASIVEEQLQDVAGGGDEEEEDKPAVVLHLCLY